MKIRSLLLGSVAAAGLSTGAFAADLGVLTSLDVCDALGLSGLTISSDTNCLQITGNVKYEFNWGDWRSITDLTVSAENDLLAPEDSVDFDDEDGINDWESRLDAQLKFVATADSDFGPAKAVIRLEYIEQRGYRSSDGLWGEFEGQDPDDAIAYEEGEHWVGGSDTGKRVAMDEAYVSIGDSTVIMAGIKGSIYDNGEDEPLNFLGLFNSEIVDTGVDDRNRYLYGEFDDAEYNDTDTGAPVIQIVSDLGNGFSVGAGLEDLDAHGAAVGVISYAGDGIAAHASFKYGDILGDHFEPELWSTHVGFAGSFENFKVVLAAAYDSSDYWNVLGSASATFDMFTIAVSAEAAGGEVQAWQDGAGPVGEGDEGTLWGVGASLSAAVTDTVTLNLGGRFLEQIDGDQVYQLAASVSAAVTETITLTGEVGYADDTEVGDLFYGAAEVAWAPGGGFTSSVKAQANTQGGYKATFKAAKTFE